MRSVEGDPMVWPHPQEIKKKSHVLSQLEKHIHNSEFICCSMRRDENVNL